MKIGADLCITAAENDLNKMKICIEALMPVNAPDYDGRTALHVAASRGLDTMCNLLIESGGIMDK